MPGDGLPHAVKVSIVMSGKVLHLHSTSAITM